MEWPVSFIGLSLPSMYGDQFVKQQGSKDSHSHGWGTGQARLWPIPDKQSWVLGWLELEGRGSAKGASRILPRKGGVLQARLGFKVKCCVHPPQSSAGLGGEGQPNTHAHLTPAESALGGLGGADSCLGSGSLQGLQRRQGSHGLTPRPPPSHWAWTPGQGGDSQVPAAQSRGQSLGSGLSEWSALQVWHRVGYARHLPTSLWPSLGFHRGPWAGLAGPPPPAFPTLSLGAAMSPVRPQQATQKQWGHTLPGRSQG